MAIRLVVPALSLAVGHGDAAPRGAIMTNRQQRRAQAAAGRHALVSSRDRANTVMRDLVRVHQAFDAAQRAELKAQGTLERVSCRRGCSHCCEQSIIIPYAEALLIVAKHLTVVREVRRELERQEMLAARLGAVDWDSASSPDFLFSWWRTRTPCAFLDPVTRDCRVYDDRPTVCRHYGVIDDKPEWCAIRVDSLEQARTLPIVNEIPRGQAWQIAMLGGATATVETCGGNVSGLLPTMVNHALMQVEEGLARE